MRGMPISLRSAGRALSWLIWLLALSAVYLYAYPQPNVFYAGVVLLHALGGVLAAILLIVVLVRAVSAGSPASGSREPEAGSPKPAAGSLASRGGWLLIGLGAVLGLILIVTGTPRPQATKLYLHIVISLAGVALLIAGWLGERKSPERESNASSFSVVAARIAMCSALLAGLGYGAHYIRQEWHTRNRIENPLMPPDAMNGEGDGPSGPFFPSSAQVYGGQKIPSKFFMESDSCKRCHEDIYNQWFSSAHHFSSFNNQWYRKSIEYMQDTTGTRPSK